MISITGEAKNKFLEAAKAEGREGHALRINVHNGGSYRPEFALNFAAPDEVTDDDQVVDADGIKLYIDAESAKWLEGASINFVENLQESGFKIDAPNAGIHPPSGPVAESVRRVLDEKINPSLGSHGGHISLVAIEEDTVYLAFGGGCQGCGMANVTLKEGVERTLFEEVPEVKRVMDITDHSSGENPFYAPSK